MARRTRRRRGNPRGKAHGFHGVRPAARSRSRSRTNTGDTNTGATNTRSATSNS